MKYNKSVVKQGLIFAGVILMIGIIIGVLTGFAIWG